jgi:hypothetical protein
MTTPLTGPTGPTAPVKAPAITIQISKADLIAAVNQYLDSSPIKAEILVMKKLSWPGAALPPQLWTTLEDLVHMVGLVCSAVELAKTKLLAQADPTGKLGTKIDNEIALATAVQILGQYITFSGFLGVFVEKLKEEILNLLVSFFVEGQTPNWIGIAESILGVSL